MNLDYNAQDALADVADARGQVRHIVDDGSPWEIAVLGALVGISTASFPLPSPWSLMVSGVMLILVLVVALRSALAAGRAEQAGVRFGLVGLLRHSPRAMWVFGFLMVIGFVCFPVIDLNDLPTWYAVPVGVAQALGGLGVSWWLQRTSQTETPRR